MMKHGNTLAVACLLIAGSLLSSNVVRASVPLGTGKASLLGGDLTDPDDKIVDRDRYDHDWPEEKLKPENCNWIQMKSAPNSPPGTAPHQRHSYQSWQGAPACAIFLNNPEKRKWYVGFRDGGNGGPTKDAPYFCAVEFKDAFVLTHFTITTAPDMPGRDPRVWAIQGSITGAEDDWVDIYRCDAKDRQSSPLRENPRSETTLFTAFSAENMDKVVTPRDLAKLNAKLKGKGIAKADFPLPKKAYPWFRVVVYSCFNPNSTTFEDFNRPPGFALGQLELFGVQGVREKPAPAKVRPLDPPFILSAWSGPAASLERYREYADCGFNLVLGTDVRRPSGEAELARAVGLKAIVADRQLFAVKPDHPDFEKNVRAVVAKHSTNPAVAGFFLADEPGAGRFPELKALTDQIEKANPRLVPFINLLPAYAPPQALETRIYEEYVRRYLRAVDPPLVCWDHYPLLDNATTRPDYFENLEIVARLCRERRIPFVQVVCSVPHGMHRPPDEADLRWQAYTTLAYGARGVVYFTYTTPPSDGWGYHDAILDAKGERTVRYGYAQRLNKKLAALGPWLAKLEGVRVAHSDPVPRGGAGFDKNFPVAAATGGTMSIGWLQDADQKDHLFVVNRHFGFHQAWINTWQLSGPYQAEGKGAKQLLETPFAPEVAGDKDAAWRTVSGPAASTPDFVGSEGVMDLPSLFGGAKPNSAAYLRTRVKSPVKQDAMLALGSTAGVKAWLNGKLVHASSGSRPLALDQDKVKVVLEEGWNTLLLKVAQEAGPCRVCARFVPPNTAPNAQPGNTAPLAGLEIEGQKLRPEEVGAREFSLVLQGKASQVTEISQESGEPVRASFDPAKRTLTVKLLAGEGRLFKLSEKGISFSPPVEIVGGKDLVLDNIGFVAEQPDSKATAKLCWRRKGEATFNELPLVALARDRFKASLPASVTSAPFEYYLEMQEAGKAPVREPVQGAQAPLLATPDLTPPTAVPELAATLAKSYRVALGWKPAADDRKVTEYRVHRGAADQFKLSPSTLLAKLPADTLACTDQAPTPRATAWYAVQAVDVVGREGEARYLRVDVPDHEPPANPLKVQAIPGSRSVTLVWTGELEPIVAAVEIHRGEGKDGVLKKIGEVADPKLSRFLDKDTKVGAVYRYAVRPRSAAGLLGEPGSHVVASPLRFLKRINCGGPEIVAEDGVPWEADTGDGHPSLKYSGSRVWNTGRSVPNDVYQSERWANNGLGYSFKVDPGRYEVVLLFSESNSDFAGKGKRLFDIKINDKTVAEKVDVFSEAGGSSKPWQFRGVVEVAGSELEIKLLANPTGPALKGIEIRGLPAK